MTARYDLVLRRGKVATPNGIEPADVGIRDGCFAGLGDLSRAEAAETIDCVGLHLLPGVIDSQVHFREPGLTHKEDLGSGTAAAACGGVTLVFEMPNTKPPTDSAAALADKLSRADGRAWCDFAFFVGATAENARHLGSLERLPGCAGVKLFMGSSTGSLLVDEPDALALVLKHGRRRVAVHAEDEARLRERRTLVVDGAPVSMHPEWRDAEAAISATRRLLKLATAAGRPVHVLHISTAEEMDVLRRYRDLATVEVTPQHLTLEAPDCYDRLGTRAQMNPPIRTAEHRHALWRAVLDGTVDVLGSDHAPHTLDEKAQAYPASPSGMPGVQTLLPLMLDHVAAGLLSLERLVDLTSAGPQRIFGLAGKGRIAAGYDADLTVIDLRARRTIEDSWIRSRCRWTPFAGRTVTGWPIMTVVRGRPVMRDGELIGAPSGRPARFIDVLAPKKI